MTINILKHLIKALLILILIISKYKRDVVLCAGVDLHAHKARASPFSNGKWVGPPSKTAPMETIKWDSVLIPPLGNLDCRVLLPILLFMGALLLNIGFWFRRPKFIWNLFKDHVDTRNAEWGGWINGYAIDVGTRRIKNSAIAILTVLIAFAVGGLTLTVLTCFYGSVGIITVTYLLQHKYHKKIIIPTKWSDLSNLPLTYRCMKWWSKNRLTPHHLTVRLFINIPITYLLTSLLIISWTMHNYSWVYGIDTVWDNRWIMAIDIMKDVRSNTYKYVMPKEQPIFGNTTKQVYYPMCDIFGVWFCIINLVLNLLAAMDALGIVICGEFPTSPAKKKMYRKSLKKKMYRKSLKKKMYRKSLKKKMYRKSLKKGRRPPRDRDR